MGLNCITRRELYQVEAEREREKKRERDGQNKVNSKCNQATKVLIIHKQITVSTFHSFTADQKHLWQVPRDVISQVFAETIHGQKRIASQLKVGLPLLWYTKTHVLESFDDVQSPILLREPTRKPALAMLN